MDITKISVGQNPPWDVHVIIEIPKGTSVVKYEIDKNSGALFVDRFISTAMFYPANYGFIPHTLADDGDPLDALVLGDQPIIAGAVIRVRPIGVLYMKDEKGMDEKILMVPVDKLNSSFKDIKSFEGLSEDLCKQIVHFFTHYKDLEDGKWVEIMKWGSAEEAADLIKKTMQNGSSIH